MVIKLNYGIWMRFSQQEGSFWPQNSNSTYYYNSRQTSTEMTKYPEYQNNHQDGKLYPGFNDYQSPPSFISQPQFAKQGTLKEESEGLMQTPPPPQMPQLPQPPLPQQLINQQNVMVIEGQRYKVYPGQQMQINQNSFLYKHPNIDVKIQSYQEQPGSLFSKSYILYKITLDPYGYFISRRYSDFDKLREYLVKNYPDYYVPPIPKKVTSSTKNKIADFRQLALEKFMNTIIRQFWFDSLVDSFFSCQNDNDLQNKLKQQKQRQYDIQNLATLNGQIECQISSQIEGFFSYQSSTFSKDLECYNNIRQISKKIVGLNKQLSQEYKSLADQFVNLQQRNRGQNEQIPEKVDEIYYKHLNQMFLTWSRKQEDIGLIVTKHLSYFYKYQNQVIETLKEKIKYRDSLRDETLKQLQKIESKIDKQFKELNDSQIQQRTQTQSQEIFTEKQQKQSLFPKETKQYEVISDNFGYFNNNIYQQIQIIMNLSQYQTTQTILNMQQKMAQIYLDMVKENEQLFVRN
ncbi:unnamed protein product (macronuclear) [Paramecium tetraurelia]|uniref:PX domain-containing protein n=1 Tax=Paramecium tetraurelia TaxID=5888 RepID=A0EFR0_PARTE|nr:uncharacterized protein GSPATT00026474001 [Paramecium tetraurelia]CAK94151.1 unnamed protein product [Paramecium tetraurelia]|eukprot:XP_001461524.1 hypothetical protein (macronuclear) [Paramecium tetraurelia strain d4-2]